MRSTGPGRKSRPGARPEPASIEYATYLIPGGRSDAALAEAVRIDAVTDTCDDLYGVAKGQPAERLQRDDLPPGQIPAGIRAQLASLDPGETSYALTTADGSALVYVMLCARTPALEGEVDREAVRARLTSQALERFADALLEDLRAAATITYQ